MSTLTFLRPSTSKVPVEIEDFDFSKIRPDEMPLAHASIDGKPSDQYVPGQHYVTASLLSFDINAFDRVHKRLTELNGEKLVKPAKMQRKRRLKYLKRIISSLMKMAGEPNGVPIASNFSYTDSSALDPSTLLANLQKHRGLWPHYLITDITDRHVIFDLNGVAVSMVHAQFGGIKHWVNVACEIDKFFTQKSGRPIPWILHADTLPCDANGNRMYIFGRLLEEAIGNRVWLAFTKIDKDDEDIPVDMITDIYTHIAYEIYSPDASHDGELAEMWERYRRMRP